MRPVYLHGSAVSTTWRDASRSLTDLIFDCVSAALREAGLRAADLGAIVLAAHDLVDGRGLTSMVTAPAAAAYLRDETRLGDDGALAFVLGDARVRSGSVDTCLVAAWGRASEGPVDEISHALFDPFTARPLALTEIAVSGLRAARCLGDYPGYDRCRGAAAARRGARPDPARTPAAAWPLRAAELPVWADVVAATVLSSSPGPVRGGRRRHVHRALRPRRPGSDRAAGTAGRQRPGARGGRRPCRRGRHPGARRADALRRGARGRGRRSGRPRRGHGPAGERRPGEPGRRVRGRVLRSGDGPGADSRGGSAAVRGRDGADDGARDRVVRRRRAGAGRRATGGGVTWRNPPARTRRR